MIAALFVEAEGVYSGLPDVEVWDVTRDARKYRGPHRVVCHSPCGPWSQLAPLNQARYGRRVGDDDGCFESALASVRGWGGVLEHPALSSAWKKFRLPPPKHGRWTPGARTDEWVTSVSQRAYGHRARKATWLYVIGSKPEPIDWSDPEPVATISFLKNHGGGNLPRLAKKEAKATPPAFRDLLLRIAASS